MLSGDDFFEDEDNEEEDDFLEFSEEEWDEIVEPEPRVLKEIEVMSATVNDLYQIFFGIERDKDKPIFWRDIETVYCLFWDETSSELEKNLNLTEGLLRISIYDWGDAEGKQKDKGFPYSLDRAGEIILLQEPEGLHIRFDAIYSRPNLALISFVENRIGRIKLDKEVIVIYSYTDQNTLDEMSRFDSSHLTKSYSDVLFIDNTPTPSSQKKPEQKELEPWEQIPDHLWDREALQMWWNGRTYKEIGVRVGVGQRAVANQISILRHTYSEKIVPKNEQRNQNRFRKSHDTT